MARHHGAGLVVLVLLFSLAPVTISDATAQNDNVAPPNRQAFRFADPYAGVVSDSTVTFVGQEFYRAFVSFWREHPRVERYSLTVIERPSARWGSLVWVEHSHKRVFTVFLSPGRRDQIRPTAENAVRVVYQNLVDEEVQRLMFKDPDIGPEEL